MTRYPVLPNEMPDNPITPDTSVRTILVSWPIARPVLDRHGLLGCGGSEGPDEPIAFFARMHEVDADELLEELNAAVASEAAGRGAAPLAALAGAAPLAAPTDTAAPAALPETATPAPSVGVARTAAAAAAQGRLYRRFITGALVLTLSLGATWGVFNLTWIMYALGPVPASHVQAHGQVQVFGFLYLFIMGVAYQVLPRFRSRPLRFPGLAAATFVFLVTGVLARSVGQPIGDSPVGQFLLAVSAALYVMGVGGFAVVVIGTAVSGKKDGGAAATVGAASAGMGAGSAAPGTASVSGRSLQMTPVARRTPQSSRMEPYILAGIFWMVASAVFAAVQALVLAANGLVSLSSAWQRPLWFMSLFGAVLSWIFGIGTRVIPGFLGTRPARRRLVTAGFFLLEGGVLSMVASSVLDLSGHHAVARHLRLLAMTGVGSAILATFLGLHALRSVPELRAPGSAPPAFRLFLRAGFYWAVLAGVLYIAMAGMEWFSGREPHSLLQDAARHVFTLGALVMIVFGMATRLLPVFEGVPAASSRLVLWSFWLLNIGVVLRLTQVGAAYVWPDLMATAGASGFFALAGITGMAIVLFRTLRWGRRVSS